ncbi:MAG: LysM peptidoglycan-binding domain-containing protein [Desulfitobacterium sp.]|nr:LysM peptidoglycan-binding domain-containing protein [Desulfitobacterium sp.]
MKKRLAVILSVALALSLLAFPTFATTDTSTGASAADPAPATAPKPSTPAPATKAPAAPAATSDATYTVVKGDAMWKIAQKHGMTLKELVALNPQIKNINLIYPGQKINVKKAASSATVAPAGKLYYGVGMASNYRLRGDTPERDTLAITSAAVVFDEKGRIVDLEMDVLEINPTAFPGWRLHVAEDEAALAALTDGDKLGFAWETKREKGPEGYNMVGQNSGKTYFEQLDYYEDFFTGMTVAEVKAWFNKYTGANGKPYPLAYPDAMTDEQKAATANFTDDEKKMLIDVTTNATKAIQDNHSRFIDAIENAWNLKVELKTSL